MNYLNLLTDASIVVTGLMAGLWLGWAISVLPGLSLLPDADYLNTFQQLNRAILNPSFKSLFFVTLVLPPVTAALHIWAYGFDKSLLQVIASALLILGHGAMTVFGNIPINAVLDGLDVNRASGKIMAQQRLAFETNWRAWHWGRTVATSLAFALLLAGRLA